MLSGLGSAAAAAAVEELQRLPPRERAKPAASAGGDDVDDEEEKETRPRDRRPMEGEGATRGTRQRAPPLDSETSARVSMTRNCQSVGMVCRREVGESGLRQGRPLIASIIHSLAQSRTAIS